MKYYLFILLFLCETVTMSAQDRREGGGRGSFSLANLSSAKKNIPDSLLAVDSAALKSKRIIAYHLTPLLGEPYIAPLDTGRLNYANSTLVESKSLAVGYQANVGSAAQTRMFFERKEARDFIFADPYDYYITTPENAYFYDTKIPYTDIMYTTAGSSQNKDERLKGTLTLNFGKKINIGGDLDYIYSRGHYESNGNKLLSYRLFGSYLSDKYDLYAYLSNFNFINKENGGLTNDRYITNPDNPVEGFDSKRATDTKAFPVRFSDTWNRVRGKQYFFTQRYNLGFERELDETDEEGNAKKVFVPISSIIHTFEYKDNRRHFGSGDQGIDTCYVDHFIDTENSENKQVVEDRTSYWSLSNTLGLSLREGFQDWVKFGLTAYINFEKRRFKLPAAYDTEDGISGTQILVTPKTQQIYDEFSSFIGAELSKSQGRLLTFNARGELGLFGSDVGELRVTGNLQTRFTLFKKDAVIKADAYIKNVNPAFYVRHFHSSFFWWDNDFKKIQQVYAGGEINLESTKTKLSAGVESIQNYIFFNHKGYPEQKNGNIQVISARLKQDLKYRAFGWENEVAYQLSSDKEVLPLPQLSLYTNMYVAFKLAKVLTIQLGANMYYNTAYYAPYYEPATQQFQLQRPNEQAKVGNYPLINAYANFHLKQARFFVMAYNLSSKFVDPNYFSLSHYPLDPMVLKMGVAVMFNN
ncbi:putative porin [Parabacteroides provencensis]|uniref:putative porin n=1 Tax=Parabacteroides provencensis TaxID=1944636 RepID=UPI000C1508EB